MLRLSIQMMLGDGMIIDWWNDVAMGDVVVKQRRVHYKQEAGPDLVLAEKATHVHPHGKCDRNSGRCGPTNEANNVARAQNQTETVHCHMRPASHETLAVQSHHKGAALNGNQSIESKIYQPYIW